MSTTTDTAREVIERHIAEWEAMFPHRRNKYYAGGYNALSAVAEELDATPTNDTSRPWDGDREAFDPVRAGFVATDPFTVDGREIVDDYHWRGIDEEGEPYSFNTESMGENWEVMTRYGHVFYIPTTNADGTPRSHADVLHILRANGYEGGDDERRD